MRRKWAQDALLTSWRGGCYVKHSFIVCMSRAGHWAMIYLNLVTSLCPPVSIYCSLPGSTRAPCLDDASLYKPPYFLGTVPDGPASRNSLLDQVGHPVKMNILSRRPPCLFKPPYFLDTVPDGSASPATFFPHLYSGGIPSSFTVFIYVSSVTVDCQTTIV